MNKLAIVFPGQGSQSVGMMNDLPESKKVFDHASEILGFDLWNMAQEGPTEELNKTINTQPVLLTAGVAFWGKYKDTSPAFFAGHSLGEYTALVCAESLDFQTAVHLVRERGRFMQEAVEEGKGAMAAIIGLDPAIIQGVCDSILSYVTCANYNAIGQTVIAGTKKGVECAIKVCKEKGAKITKLLPVSVPSHCDLMKPAAERLKELLDTIELKSPKIPVINNADVVAETDPEKIKDALVRQLYNPVRWVETIEFFAREGVDKIIECGPGKVLAGLIKRIDKNIATDSRA